MFQLVQIPLKEVTCAIEFKGEYLQLTDRQTEKLLLKILKKIIEGYSTRRVREDELEYSLGYSANDRYGIIAWSRDVWENTYQVLNSARHENVAIYVILAKCRER